LRADQLLVERRLATTRSQAQRLIASGVRWRVGEQAWQAVTKNGDDLPAHAELVLQDNAEARYVSRGGLKLEGALRDSGLQVQGLRCLDVGQSTGGFTDCLLQHGAAQVVGLDVGHSQLHPRLREDARVVCVEHLNARELQVNDARIPQAELGFDVIVADVSFVSLTKVLPHVLPFLRAHGQCLLLVKPQFELQPADIGKGGLVKDPARYNDVRERMQQACDGLGLTLWGYWPSAIAGGDGNQEFWMAARRYDALDQEGARR
jgi:23S rRNA (cytidine1920-2'-O)/16S rRNA (cytidine1409-2'-O)-methyltransferase